MSSGHEQKGRCFSRYSDQGGLDGERSIAMSRILRLATLGMFTFMIALASARELKFSDWSTPINLGSDVNSPSGDFFAAISKDGLSLYFTSSRPAPDAQGGWDIYVSQRARVSEPWGPPQNLGTTINTAFDEGAPSFTRDGRHMFFSSNRPGGFGGNDIYVSRRRNKHNDLGWQAPGNLGPGVNTGANEASPAIFEEDDDDGHMITLYFDSNRPGGLGPFTDDVGHNGNDIYVSTLDDGTFRPAVLVAELSTASADRQPIVRRDGLEIFFASDRPDEESLGGLDLWVSTRATTWALWSAPVNLGSTVNSAGNEAGPAISFDAATLYFQSVRLEGFGAFDLYRITRTKLKERREDDDRD
jgi:WD40 repeat protein